MKFSDGYWLTRPGFTVLRPIEVAQASTDGETLTVLAGTKPATGRGWDLNLATATITLSAPLPGIVRVRIEHHRGARNDGPHFDLPGVGVPDPAEIATRLSSESASLTSGPLTATVVREGQLRIDFSARDRVLTSSLPRGIGLATDDTGGPFVFQQLSLGVGDLVYGLGERFGPLVKNGQSVDIWNEDGGTASE